MTARIASLLALLLCLLGVTTPLRAAAADAAARIDAYAVGLEKLNEQVASSSALLPPAAELEAGPQGRPGSSPSRIGRGASLVARHGMGFLHFSAVLSTYLGARLLIEVEEGRLRRDEMMEVMHEAVASKEAMAAYFRFVGVYAVADRIMAKGAQAVAPGLAGQAAELAGLKSLACNFMRHHLVLVAVVTTLDTAEHAVPILAGRPWETEATARPDLPWHRAYLGALVRDPRHVLASTLGSIAQAFGEVDMVDVVITQAGFVAGMLFASAVPGLGQSGFFQLAMGFVLADLASRCVAAPLREHVIAPASLIRAHETLFRRRRALFAAGGRDWSSAELETMKSEQLALSRSLENDRKKERETFEAAFTTLILAACGKLDNRVSNLRNHFWIDGWNLPGLRIASSQELVRMPEILAQIREEWDESRRAYEKTLDEHLHLVEVLRGSAFDEKVGGEFSLDGLRSALEAGRVAGEAEARGLAEDLATRRRAARAFHEHLALEASVLRGERRQLELQAARIEELLAGGELERTLHGAVTARLQALHLERLETKRASGRVGLAAARRLAAEERGLKALDARLTERHGPARKSASYVTNFDVRSQRLEELGTKAREAADGLVEARRKLDEAGAALLGLCRRAMKEGRAVAAHAAVVLELAAQLGDEAVDGELLAEARRHGADRRALVAEMESRNTIRAISSTARLALPVSADQPEIRSASRGETVMSEVAETDPVDGAAALLSLLRTGQGELEKRRRAYEEIRTSYNDEVRALFPEEFVSDALGQDAAPVTDDEPDFDDLSDAVAF